MSSRSEFEVRPDVPPSTIAHHHHHHHHPMTSSTLFPASSYPTLTSAVDAEFDVGYLSGNGCCVAAPASFVDRAPLPVPVLDCACTDGRFRPRRSAENRESPATNCPDHPESSSFKDAAADRLLRMPNAILLPVADSAVNYGLEDPRTSLRTVDVCRSCCTDSPIT